MDLLREELFDTNFSIVNEKKEELPPGVLMRVSGPIGITEKKNRNGRTYRNSFWKEILGRDEIQKQLNERALVGAADHPQTFVPPVASISHVMTRAYLDEQTNALMADADVLDTPMGKIVKTCFDANVKIGASTRGAGKNAQSVSGEVKSEGFRWGGFDFVFEPSAQNAYPEAVREQVEKIISDASVAELVTEGTDTADARKMYESVLSKFGCSTSLLLEKFGEAEPPKDFEKMFNEKEIELSNTIAKLEENREKVQALVEAYRKSQESQSPAELEALKLQLEVAQEKIDSLERIVEAKNNEISEMSEEMSKDKVATESSTQTPVFEGEKKITSLVSRVSMVERENEELRMALSSVTEEAQLLEKETMTLRTKLRALNEDFERVSEERSELRIQQYASLTGISEQEIQEMGGDEMTLEQVQEIIEDSPKPVARKSLGILESAPRISSYEMVTEGKSVESNKTANNVASMIKTINSRKR